MYISDLNIRGYGIFQDCQINSLPSGLSIFLGDNEAGKSTCLFFVRDLLFGAPDGRSKERSYPALRGGRWGGSMALNCPDWGSLVLERGPGSKGGKLTLIGPEGENLPQETLNQILGGTTREVFQNVYAFSLSELQSLESLNNDRVKNAIYSAGLGSGVSSLPEVIKQLEDRRKELFKPGGKSQKIHHLLKKLKEVQAEITQASGQIEAYDRMEEELNELKQKYQKLKKDLFGMNARFSRLNNLHFLWEEWIERQGLKRKLHDLPEIKSFPEEGLKRYEALSQKLEQQKELRDSLQSEMDSLKARLNRLIIVQKLLDREQTVRSLSEEKSGFLEAKEEIIRIRPELKAKQERLQAIMRRLGSAWTRDGLQAFDCSLKLKEGIGEFATSFKDREQTKERAYQNLEARKQDLGRIKESLQNVDEEIYNLDAQAMNFDKKLASELRRERDRFAQALEEVFSLRQFRDRGVHAVKGFLLDIDPSWSFRDLEGFETSLQVKERIEVFKNGLENKDKDLLRLQQELSSCQDNLNSLEDKKIIRLRSWEGLQRPRFESLEQIHKTWQKIKELRGKISDKANLGIRIEALENRLAELKGQIEELEPEPRQSKLLPFAALSMLYSCALILALVGIEVLPRFAGWISGAVLGALGAFASGLYFLEKHKHTKKMAEWAKKRSELNKELQGANELLQGHRQKEDGLTAQISENMQWLGLIEPSGLDELENELEQARDLLFEIKRLKNELKDLSKDINRSREKEKALKKNLDELKSAQTELEESWKQELAGLGLNRQVAPGAALRLMDKVETAKSELAHLRETEDRLQQIESFLQKYTDKALKISEASGLAAKSNEQVLSAVDLHLERVSQEEERLRTRELKAQERGRLAKEMDRIERERQQAEKEFVQAEDALEAEKLRWRHWLEQAGLDKDLSPELTREALADIEKAQALIGQEQELIDKKKQSEGRVRKFISRVRELALDLRRSEPEATMLLPFVEALVQELESSKSDARRRRDIEEQLLDKEKALNDYDKKIGQTREKMDYLFKLAQAENKEDFLRLGRIKEKREEISERLQVLESSLMRGTGQNSIQAVEREFAGWTLEGLKKDLNWLKQEIEEKEGQRDEISNRIGEIRSEKKRLAKAEKMSELRQKEEFLRQDLSEAAKRWSKYTLALYLIRKAKDKYEQEQQPQVLKTAGYYLKEITGGAYTRVFAPLGESEVHAVDKNGLPKRPEELSRGTAEQLYLSLRFGYVDNAGQHGARLPLIMDDILVNFDCKRAEKAAMAIAELAKQSQVLYFTCHPETLELFSQAAPEAAVFDLNQGSIQSRNHCSLHYSELLNSA